MALSVSISVHLIVWTARATPLMVYVFVNKDLPVQIVISAFLGGLDPIV